MTRKHSAILANILKLTKEEPMRRLLIIFAFLILVYIIAMMPFLKPRRPNIFLITIDALRADHLSCYGYQRETTPYIDQLARESVVFSNCFSTGSSTAYSFVASLTGRYLTVREDYVGKLNVLDKKFTTLAEYLKSAGYTTVAFINNGNLNYGKGFEQGFDHYYTAMGQAKAMTDSVLYFLDSYRNKKPLFIWVHYIGPHTPYESFGDDIAGEFSHLFIDDALYKENDRTLKLKPEVDPEKKDKIYNWSSQGYIPPEVFREGNSNLNYYIACYDAEIRYTDFYIGELLRRGNIKDADLIILSADHGESLGEHDVYFSHGENIYDEVLHVPLIIRDKEYSGHKTISTPVSTLDIVPTILNKINPLWAFLNKRRFNGVDLAGIISHRNMKRKLIYSYSSYDWSVRNIENNTKYILSMDNGEQLYFLPDEYNNYMKDETERTNQAKVILRDNLRKWRKRYPIRADSKSIDVNIDKETEESLKKLGYLH